MEEEKGGEEDHLRSSRQRQFTRRPTHHIRTVNTRITLLAQLRIRRQLLCIRGVDHHDLSELTMWARRTVQIHWLCARNWHVKCADLCLAVLERDVSAVHTAVHGRTGFVSRRLCDGVVAVRELELYNVADGSSDGVRDEGVLGTADDDRDDLTGTAEGVTWLESVS